MYVLKLLDPTSDLYINHRVGVVDDPNAPPPNSAAVVVEDSAANVAIAAEDSSKGGEQDGVLSARRKNVKNAVSLIEQPISEHRSNTHSK